MSDEYHEGYKAGFMAGGSLATRQSLTVIGALVGGRLGGEVTIPACDLAANWEVERSDTPGVGLRFRARRRDR